MSNEQGQQGGNISAVAGVAFAGYLLWKAAQSFADKLVNFVDNQSAKKDGDSNNR